MLDLRDRADAVGCGDPSRALVLGLSRQGHHSDALRASAAFGVGLPFAAI